MALDKNYVASQKAWDKAQVALIDILNNSIQFSKKDIELAKIRMAAEKQQLTSSIELLRKARVGFKRYLKNNG